MDGLGDRGITMSFGKLQGKSTQELIDELRTLGAFFSTEASVLLDQRVVSLEDQVALLEGQIGTRTYKSGLTNVALGALGAGARGNAGAITHGFASAPAGILCDVMEGGSLAFGLIVCGIRPNNTATTFFAQLYNGTGGATAAGNVDLSWLAWQ